MTVYGWLYRGHIYRQLIDAHWAAFFDALDLEYTYDVGGLELACGHWIPSSFWLPEVGRDIEVRDWPSHGAGADFWPDHPAWPDEDDEETVVDEAARRLVVIYGPPVCRGKPHQGEYRGYRIANASDMTDDFLYSAYIFGDSFYLWTQCPACGRVGVEFEGRAARLCDCFPDSDRVFNTLSPRLLRAYEAAWSGAQPVRRRLWHGLLRPGLDRELMAG
jgi:hypothetical protein